MGKGKGALSMKLSTKSDDEVTARPVMWLIEGYVDYKVETYKFWFEYDGRDGEVNYEFTHCQPPDDFDYDEFRRLCLQLIDSERWAQ